MLPRFLHLLMVAGALCYNIDYEYSVVKTGSQDSFFGFSVIQHTEGNNNWMLVGAPKANSSFINNPNSKDKRSGSVFKCDAKTPSMECTEQVPFDETPTTQADSKTDMWLGVTLKSSKAGQVLSCGHRYEFFGNSIEKSFSLLVGECYAVEKDLSIAVGDYSPCKTIVRRYASSNEVPGYQNYGQCQLGLGVAIQDKKNSDEEDEYSLGGLGALTFRGRVFKEKADNTNLRWSSMDLTTKSFEDSYFGYAVALGKFTTLNEKEIAVSGPRHESHGKVLIYNNKQFKDTNKEDSSIQYVQQIPSDYVKADVQIASGFGIAICAIDIDVDGFDDIVIGAPFYGLKKKPNMGKVYIYGRSKSSAILTEKQVLTGNSEAFASFGYAVANVGDLNLDGFPELVVGAPHSKDNKGAVFIYSGTNTGLSDNPQVVVAGKVMSAFSNAGALTLGGFGRSIAGGMDLDNNGYPDVLIGAYSTGHAVLLRSRPVIFPHSTMTFSTKQIDPEAKNAACGPGKKVCFTATICHNITGPEGSTAPVDNIDLKFTVTADAGRPNDPRVYIEDSNIFEMTGLSSKEKKCFEIKDMYLKFQPDGSIAEYPDLKFTIAYSIPYGEPKGPILPARSSVEVVSLKTFPILSRKFRDGHALVAGLDSVDLTFKRQCIKCIPDLKINSISSNFTLGLGRNEFEFNITIENDGDDPAYAVDFTFQSPEYFKIAIVKEIGSTKAKDCSNNTCKNLISKLGSKSKKQFSIILNTERFKPETPNVAVMKVSSINDEKQETLADNSKTITFDIRVVADITLVAGKSTQQVAYTGKIKGERAMIDLEDIGNEVEHRYAVRNRGPDLLPMSILTIQWPALTVSGKHLLYLTEVIKSSRTVCGKIKTNTADIRRIRTSTNTQRKRREVETTSNSKNETSSITDESGNTKSDIDVLKPRDGITLQCGDGTAECVTFSCEIKDLPSKVSETIVFKARLWEPSLLLDYYGEVLTIISSGQVKLGQNASYISDPDPNNNKNELYTVINPVLVKPKREIAVWIIALAVVAGIILLALLVFGLFKLGFFKRNRKPEYTPNRSENKSLIK